MPPSSLPPHDLPRLPHTTAPQLHDARRTRTPVTSTCPGCAILPACPASSHHILPHPQFSSRIASTCWVFSAIPPFSHAPTQFAYPSTSLPLLMAPYHTAVRRHGVLLPAACRAEGLHCLSLCRPPFCSRAVRHMVAEALMPMRCIRLFGCVRGNAAPRCITPCVRIYSSLHDCRHYVHHRLRTARATRWILHSAALFWLPRTRAAFLRLSCVRTPAASCAASRRLPYVHFLCLPYLRLFSVYLA